MRHRWGAPERHLHKTERVCGRCGLVRVTRHDAGAGAIPWVEFWTRDGERINLTPKELAVLEAMAAPLNVRCSVVVRWAQLLTASITASAVIADFDLMGPPWGIRRYAGKGEMGDVGTRSQCRRRVSPRESAPR